MSDKTKDITQVFQGLTEYAELQAFSNAQTKTILELNKKVNALERECSELRKTIAHVEVESRKEKDKAVSSETMDEQAICEMQLSILRDRSLEGELTLEETKKVEIFARLLMQLRSPSKKQEDLVGKMDTKDLLRLVEGGATDVS